MVIWTNHAKERLAQRGISFGQADKTVRFPDNIKVSGTSKKFQKTFDGYSITVAVKREKNDWIVVSSWKSKSFDKKYQPFILERLIRFLINLLEQAFQSSR